MTIPKNRDSSGTVVHYIQIRQAGGIAARWRTLGNVMDISTTDTSVPRARQLRDEPQSGRYPTADISGVNRR